MEQKSKESSLPKSSLNFISKPDLKPTVVYDTYWRFATERQNIFFKRLKSSALPWTEDPILTNYKFTNAYRASDRVSQYLISQVIYSGDQSAEEVFFRIILFKLFNKIETWEKLKAYFGCLSYSEYSYERYDKVLMDALSKGHRIYSAAYMMASGHSDFAVARKHQAHLKLLERMIDDRLPSQVAEAKTMREAFFLLRSYPMIGDFLAYQYVTDLNYSNLTDFSEMEFTIPGPGARDGICKCFGQLNGVSEEYIIKYMADRQEIEFERLGLNFQSLWGRPLHLIDIQNIFCEVDKYSRIKHPEISGISGRTRIKQKFKSCSKPINFWFPPKWELNEKIKNCSLF